MDAPRNQLLPSAPAPGSPPPRALLWPRRCGPPRWREPTEARGPGFPIPRMCPERNVDYLMPEAFIYSAATTPWSALRRDRTSGDGAKSSRPGRAWTQTILCPNPSVWREPLGPQTPVQPGLHCRPPFVFFRVTKQLLVKQRKTKTPRTTPEIIHLRSSSFTPRKLGFTLNKGKPPPPGPVFSPTPFIKITQG